MHLGLRLFSPGLSRVLSLDHLFLATRLWMAAFVELPLFTRMSHRLWFVGEVDVEAMVLFHRVTVAAVFRFHLLLRTRLGGTGSRPSRSKLPG